MGEWRTGNGECGVGNGEWEIEMGRKSGQSSFEPRGSPIFPVTDACGRQSRSVSLTWKVRVFY